MKYIRTKDGRIVDTSKKDYFIKDNDLVLHEQYETIGGLPCEKGSMTQLSVAVITKHNEYRFAGTIEKQADTIEELCDVGVIINWTEVGEPILCKYDKELKSMCFKRANSQYVEYMFAEDLIKSGCTIYGAIWTDKGLIYVAKMNDKGVLELL